MIYTFPIFPQERPSFNLQLQIIQIFTWLLFSCRIIPLGSSSYGLPVAAAAAEVWGTQCYRRPARLHDLARWEDLGKICAVAFQSFAHHPCCLSPNTEAWSSLPRWPPNLPVLFWLYEPGLNVSIVNPMIEMYFDCPFHLCCSFPPPPPPLYPSLLLTCLWSWWRRCFGR